MKKFLLSTTLVVTFALTAQSIDGISTRISAYALPLETIFNELSIVPNRATGEAQVRFKSAGSGEAAIVVLNEDGEIVLQQQNQLTTGINNLSIVNVLKLDEGSYTVRLVAGGRTYSSTLLIWK